MSKLHRMYLIMNLKIIHNIILHPLYDTLKVWKERLDMSKKITLSLFLMAFSLSTF